MLARGGFGRALLCLVVALGLASGCAKPRPKTWYPPRVELERFGALAMIEFSSASGDGLGVLASREFLAAIQSAQPGTPVLELGDERHVLAKLPADRVEFESIRALGEKYGVDAVIVGAVQPEKVQPNVAFDSGSLWMTASAEIERGLDVRILDTRSGATLWSSATRAKAEIARLNLDPSGVSGGGGNRPDDARLRLVRRLVRSATGDFWPYSQ